MMDNGIIVFGVVIILAIIWILLGNYYKPRIMKLAKKYPKVYDKMLFPFLGRTYFLNNFNSKDKQKLNFKLKAFSIYFKQIIFFHGFTKNNYNDSFNELYNYYEAKNTRNKDLISALDKQKKIFRIHLIIFSILFWSFVGFLLFLLYSFLKI